MCVLSVIPTIAFAQGRFAALVVDANSGRTISATSADEPRHPASLTKMMTLYVVFDLIERKKLTYDTLITFSQDATDVQPTKLGVAAGDTVTVREIVRALIVKSANDAAIAIAEHVSGSEEAFAELMTRTARSIGMANTTFKNAHGLHDRAQITTARDMITLGLRLQDDFPRQYAQFATTDFNFRGQAMRNHNTMLTTYEGMDGIKTGYINASGFNLVANVKRGDKHVIGVVFGGPSPRARNETMRNLLNLALVKGSSTKTRQIVARVARPPDPQTAPAPVPVPRGVARAPAIAARSAIPPPAAPAPSPAPQRTAAVEPIAAPQPRAADVPLAKVRPVLVAPPAIATSRPEPPTFTPPPLASAILPTAPVQPAPPATPSAITRTAQAPQPAARLGVPVVAGGVHLQVGAYATSADAERQLAAVKAAAPELAGTLTGRAIPAEANGKAFFRARFVDVDAGAAGRLCNDLRRRQIDCLVVKAE
jgi:D-alanyl-D-alanine carboxypeptidase